MRASESDIPTEPHNDAPELPTLPSPGPVTLESVWDKLCHIERKQELMAADLDIMFKFVRSSVRQLEDSDLPDRVSALERLASGARLNSQNGSNGHGS